MERQMEELTITAYEDDFESEYDDNNKESALDSNPNKTDTEIEEGEITSDSSSQDDVDDYGEEAVLCLNNKTTNEFKCGIKYVSLIENPNSEYDIYIGGNSKSHHASIWQNPYEGYSRIDMFKRYEEHITSNSFFLSKLPELFNKRLACW